VTRRKDEKDKNDQKGLEGIEQRLSLVGSFILNRFYLSQQRARRGPKGICSRRKMRY
jgi:hypothetical protein